MIRAGSLYSVLRDASFSALFSLRVAGSECVYTGLEEEGLSSESAAWTFLLFLELGRG